MKKYLDDLKFIGNDSNQEGRRKPLEPSKQTKQTENKMPYSQYRIKKTDTGYTLSRFCTASYEWWVYETYNTLEEAKAGELLLKAQKMLSHH